MSKKIAVFPGTFDPVTIGHESIVLRASTLFDEVIVAIGHNEAKNTHFSLKKRKTLLELTFNKLKNVRVEVYKGLTIDFCKSVKAKYLIRGLRNSIDFEYEKSIAQMNLEISNGKVDTYFVMCKPSETAISSSIVRELINNNLNPLKYLPSSIHGKLSD